MSAGSPATPGPTEATLSEQLQPLFNNQRPGVVFKRERNQTSDGFRINAGLSEAAAPIGLIPEIGAFGHEVQVTPTCIVPAFTPAALARQ